MVPLRPPEADVALLSLPISCGCIDWQAALRTKTCICCLVLEGIPRLQQGRTGMSRGDGV